MTAYPRRRIVPSQEITGPVSLTSIANMYKMVESIIKDKLVEHLQNFNLLDDSQQGFMKGKSCLTNLLEYFENITKFLDQGIYWMSFTWILPKHSLNKAPHKRLFKELEAHME